MRPLRVLLCFSLFAVTDLQAQWEMQLDLQNYTYLYRIFFLNENSGWAIGSAIMGDRNNITVIIPGENRLIRIKFFDIYGRCVLTKEKNPDDNSQISINLHGIAEGINPLQTQTGNARYSDKIIIKK